MEPAIPGTERQRGSTMLAVGPLRVHALIEASRRRLAVLAVFGFLIVGVAMHHVPTIDMHAASVGVCLAVLQVAAAVAILGAARPSACRWSARVLAVRSIAVPDPITAPARAGPRHLEVLRL